MPVKDNGGAGGKVPGVPGGDGRLVGQAVRLLFSFVANKGGNWVRSVIFGVRED